MKTPNPPDGSVSRKHATSREENPPERITRAQTNDDSPERVQNCSSTNPNFDVTFLVNGICDTAGGHILTSIQGFKREDKDQAKKVPFQRHLKKRRKRNGGHHKAKDSHKKSTNLDVSIMTEKQQHDARRARLCADVLARVPESEMALEKMAPEAREAMLDVWQQTMQCFESYKEKPFKYSKTLPEHRHKVVPYPAMPLDAAPEKKVSAQLIKAGISLKERQELSLHMHDASESSRNCGKKTRNSSQTAASSKTTQACCLSARSTRQNADVAASAAPDASHGKCTPKRTSSYETLCHDIDTLEQEEQFYARPSVKIPIPDTLKAMLVDDWENVTKNQQLVPLPHAHPVDEILNEYLEHERPSRVTGSAQVTILEETIAGLRTYFDMCVGRILLYRQEFFFELALPGVDITGAPYIYIRLRKPH